MNVKNRSQTVMRFLAILSLALMPVASTWAASDVSGSMASNGAGIVVKLKAPQWEFLLDNQPTAASEAQLSPRESSFARSIQPLLATHDHAAIRQAFEKRNIDKDSAALRLLRGQILLSLKRYQEAEHALKSALTRLPSLASAHRSLSMVYMLKKQYKQARQHLTRSIELGVADAQIYGQLAFVNLQLGQAASAVAGYQYALFLDAENDQWRKGLLYALIQSHAFDQAQALVEELLKSDPNNADLWLQRGQLALKQERPQQALSSLETALSLGEKDADNIAITAQLHIQSGSPRRAVELLAGHINTLVDAGKIDVLDQIAAWLAYQEDWQQLDRLIRSVNLSNAKLPARYRSRFSVYQAQLVLFGGKGFEGRGFEANEPGFKKTNGKGFGDKTRRHKQKTARKHLQAAIDADPTNGEALLTLATLLRDQNRSERAVLYYIRAEALTLFKERALLGRAQLEIDRQNYSEALRLLRAVAIANPNRGDVLANIQSLENLVRSQG